MRGAAGDHAGIGLACAGGVVEGAFFEIGALCALDEAVEGLDLTRLDVYVGVSAGSIIVSGLANGITPREMAEVLFSRRPHDLDLRPGTLMTPALGEFGRRLMGVPAIVAAALARYAVHPRDLSVRGALAQLQEAIPAGIFDNRPLERYLSRVLSMQGRTNDFRRLRARLRIVAVNLDTSESAVFGEPGMDAVPISRAVQASTALPVLFPPVEIDGAWYIDGVARRTLHATAALDAGVRMLLCINPIVPVDLRVGGVVAKGEHLVHHGLPAVLSQTLRTLVHSRMRTAFRGYERDYPDADVVLIEPEVEDPTLFFSNLFSFSSRAKVGDYGYRTTRAYLRREARHLGPIFARHGLRIRADVIRDPARGMADYAGDGASPRRDGAGAGAALDRLDGALERLEAALSRQ